LKLLLKKTLLPVSSANTTRVNAIGHKDPWNNTAFAAVTPLSHSAIPLFYSADQGRLQE